MDRDFSFCVVPGFDCCGAFSCRTLSFASSYWNGSYKIKNYCCLLVDLRTRLEHSNVCAVSLQQSKWTLLPKLAQSIFGSSQSNLVGHQHSCDTCDYYGLSLYSDCPKTMEEYTTGENSVRESKVGKPNIESVPLVYVSFECGTNSYTEGKPARSTYYEKQQYSNFGF